MWIRKELLDATLDFQCLRAGYSETGTKYTEQSGTNDCCVISVVTKGYFQRQFFNPDEAASVSAGSVAYLPAWRQGWAATPEGAHCGWLHFRFIFLGGHDYLNFFNVPLVFPKKETGILTDIHTRVAALCAESSAMGYKELALVKIQGFRLLEVVLRNSAMKQNSEELLQSLNRLNEALRHIREHYREHMGIDLLARKANMSRARFHVNFERAVGISPMKYLRVYRMERAKELLLTSDLDMEAVAAEVGYPDQFHFSRNFRSLVGVCPRDYRNRKAISMY